MARSRTVPAVDDDESAAGGGAGAAGGCGEGEPVVAGKAGVVGGLQPLSRAQRLRQQSNMSFWLILKKKNDLQAKAARVQELRAMLEKIRYVLLSFASRGTLLYTSIYPRCCVMVVAVRAMIQR